MDDRELERHFAEQRGTEAASFSVLERLSSELAALESARAATRLGRAQGLPGAEDRWAVEGPGGRLERSDFEEALDGLCAAAGATLDASELPRGDEKECVSAGSAEEKPLELADFENSPNSASFAPPGPQDAQEQRNEARRRMLEYFAARLPRAAKEARSAAPLPLSLADVVEQRILSSGQLPIPDAPSVLGYIV